MVRLCKSYPKNANIEYKKNCVYFAQRITRRHNKKKAIVNDIACASLVCVLMPCVVPLSGKGFV